MSTVEDVEYCEGYHQHFEGYSVFWRKTTQTMIFTYLWFPFTVLIVSPTVMMVSLHINEHLPYSIVDGIHLQYKWHPPTVHNSLTTMTRENKGKQRKENL